MKILAIDTSSKNCSVAVVEFNDNSFKVLAFDNSSDERTHSQKLMPMIEQLLSQSSISLNDIDLLASCIGPGSFTGIRIGVATVKAFSDSRDIPVAGITSLESLSYLVEENGYIFPIIDAKNENVYAAGYKVDNNNHLVKIDGFADSIKNTLDNFLTFLSSENINNSDCSITFVGDGAENYRDIISEKFDQFNIIFSKQNEQNAVALAKCAYNKYLNNQIGNSDTVFPVYLRKSQAERIANGEPK